MGLTVLTVEEAAEMLKTSKQQIRKMIRDGVLPAVKVGREWRISFEYLEDFMNSALDA